eukprot:scaffold300102_cov14-Tisochrysis_lutea.AAC.1
MPDLHPEFKSFQGITQRPKAPILADQAVVVQNKTEKNSNGIMNYSKETNGCNGCLAAPAYVGSLAETKIVPVTKPARAGDQELNIRVSHSISCTVRVVL